MKKFMIFLGLSVVVAFVAFCVMFWFALRQGPSLDTLTNRISKSLMVDPSRLSFMGGYKARDLRGQALREARFSRVLWCPSIYCLIVCIV